MSHRRGTNGHSRGGSVTPEIAQSDTIQTDTTNSSTYTFNGVSFDAEDANRYIVVVAAVAPNTASITGMTIGGVTATLVVATGHVAMYVAHVPTGSTGTVVISGSGSPLRCAMAPYRALINSPTPLDSDNSTGEDPTINLTGGQIGSVVVGMSHHNSSTASTSVSGDATEDDEITSLEATNFRFTVCSGIATDTSPSVTFTYGGTPAVKAALLATFY